MDKMKVWHWSWRKPSGLLHSNRSRIVLWSFALILPPKVGVYAWLKLSKSEVWGVRTPNSTFSSLAEVRGRPLSWPFGRCQEDAGRGYWELNSGCFEIVGFCFLEWQINQLKQSTKAQKLLFSATLLERRWFFHQYFSGFFSQSCGHTLQWGATAGRKDGVYCSRAGLAAGPGAGRLTLALRQPYPWIGFLKNCELLWHIFFWIIVIVLKYTIYNDFVIIYLCMRILVSFWPVHWTVSLMTIMDHQEWSSPRFWKSAAEECQSPTWGVEGLNQIEHDP